MEKRIVRTGSGKNTLTWQYSPGDDHVMLYYEDSNEGVLRMGLQTYCAQVSVATEAPALALGIHPDLSDEEIEENLEHIRKVAFNRLEVDLGLSVVNGGKEAAGLLASITLVEAAGLVLDPTELRTMVAMTVAALAHKELEEGKKDDPMDILKLKSLMEMGKTLVTGKTGDRTHSDLLKKLIEPGDPDMDQKLVDLQEMEDKLTEKRRKKDKEDGMGWKAGWNF